MGATRQKSALIGATPRPAPRPGPAQQAARTHLLGRIGAFLGDFHVRDGHGARGRGVCLRLEVPQLALVQHKPATFPKVVGATTLVQEAGLVDHVGLQAYRSTHVPRTAGCAGADRCCQRPPSFPFPCTSWHGKALVPRRPGRRRSCPHVLQRPRATCRPLRDRPGPTTVPPVHDVARRTAATVLRGRERARCGHATQDVRRAAGDTFEPRQQFGRRSCDDDCARLARHRTARAARPAQSGHSAPQPSGSSWTGRCHC